MVMHYGDPQQQTDLIAPLGIGKPWWFLLMLLLTNGHEDNSSTLITPGSFPLPPQLRQANKQDGIIEEDKPIIPWLFN